MLSVCDLSRQLLVSDNYILDDLLKHPYFTAKISSEIDSITKPLIHNPYQDHETSNPLQDEALSYVKFQQKSQSLKNNVPLKGRKCYVCKEILSERHYFYPRVHKKTLK